MGTGEHVPIPVEDDSTSTSDTELAQIVHDLKNPLSSIALEAELLDVRIAAGDRSNAAQGVNRIMRNVMYLDRLVYDLLDASTLSTGQFTLRRATCDLRPLVVAVIERVVPACDRDRVHLDARESLRVRVDELRIERVISNLLDNALKYTPATGGIVVRLAKESNTACISVSDGGPGLSPTESCFVFEPYRRASTSLGRPGNGLGLYVSRRIIEAHGGRIGVESTRGAGARFFFDLPLD